MNKVPELFDWVNDLSYKKERLIDQDPETHKNFLPFMINRAFSQGVDTVMYANEMNKASGISDRMLYDFYFHSLRPYKRFNKWAKTTKIDYLPDVQKYFNFSLRKAQDALRILTMDELKEIRHNLDTGGKK